MDTATSKGKLQFFKMSSSRGLLVLALGTLHACVCMCNVCAMRGIPDVCIYRCSCGCKGCVFWTLNIQIYTMQYMHRMKNSIHTRVKNMIGPQPLYMTTRQHLQELRRLVTATRVLSSVSHILSLLHIVRFAGYMHVFASYHVNYARVSCCTYYV